MKQPKFKPGDRVILRSVDYVLKSRRYHYLNWADHEDVIKSLQGKIITLSKDSIKDYTDINIYITCYHLRDYNINFPEDCFIPATVKYKKLKEQL